MLTRRTVVTAITETTYGTDPAMTGTNALMAWDVNLDVKGEVLDRVYLRDTLTNLSPVIGMKEVELSLKAELVGSGGMLAPLISACGFGTGVITGTAFAFALQSVEALMPSVALWVFKDGNKHKVTGARGNVKFILEAGKFGIAEFVFKGLYNPVQADTVPNIEGLAVIQPNKPPICYNSSFQIGGFSPVSSKLEIDLGNEVVSSPSLNASYGIYNFRISGRKPKISFDADAVVEASNPFWGDWSGQVVDTFSIDVGLGNTANRYIINGIFQYTQNKYADKDGISKYECEAVLVGSNADTTNDELAIKFLNA
jgi:hypothetical protein